MLEWYYEVTGYLGEINALSTFVRLALALICGGVLGMERGKKNRPAGFRTYMLVCVGATLVMLTNQYICNLYGTGDPARLGAQVISGIGFLGAGTIMVTGNNKIKGLTTAAGLWSAACIGLAIGIGFYEGAIAAGAAILFIMTVFKDVERKILKKSKALRLYVSVETNEALNDLIEECHSRKIRVDDIQVSKPRQGTKGGIIAFLTLKLNTKQSHTKLVHQLSELNGILYIEELS